MNKITIPWPGWTVVREIGRGGFGTVYEISRTDQFGYEEKAALKVIRIPNEAGVINQFRMDGYDNASISARLKEDARKINQEYYLQNQLKGNPNVVRVDENMVTAHEDGLGWDIFIRMELLRPMMEVLMKKQDFSEKEIIKIGKDICEALNVCHRRDIIHRDIKPDNIFLSDTGDWKLGDFGIARTMEHSTRATKAGTYNYLAPEVFHGEKYGKQVDIYSLGMVLYWLLNKRRRPFLPVDRPPTASEDEQARIKRFRGDPLPSPVRGSEELKRIVLKACAYHPKDRYSSPEEMLMDLQAVESGAHQGNAPAAAGKDEYDSFTVLESAYEESGRSAVYGNGSHENGTDASAGNRTAPAYGYGSDASNGNRSAAAYGYGTDASAGSGTAGAYGYGADASVGNGSASGSNSAAGEGVSMGNGWEGEDPGTIGNPYKTMGGRNKIDFSEDQTEGAFSIGGNGTWKDEPDSFTVLESANEGSGISTGYGNGSYGNGSYEPSAQKTGGSGKIYLLFGLSAIVIIMVSAWFLSNSGGESSTGTGSSNTVSSNTVSSENNNGYETDVNDTDSEGDDYISEPGLIDPFLGDGWVSGSMDTDRNGNNVPYFTAVIYDGYIEKKYADGGTDTELIYEVVEDDEGIMIRMCDGTAYFAQQGSFNILWLYFDYERKSDNMSASDSLYRDSNTSSNNNYIETQSSDTGSNEYTPEQLRQMGLDYFKRHNDLDGVPYVPYSEVWEESDGTYVVRVYAHVLDHVTTWARYEVDSSGKGEETSYNGGYVDLTQ